MSDKWYNILKKIALYVLPAVILFIEGFVKIWGIPYGNEVALTVALFNTALSTALGVSTAKYNRRIK